jgi:hypothetical protein
MSALGDACVNLAIAEMQSGVKANPYGQPNTGPRVAEYLAGCVRDVDHDGDLERLGLTVGNWCAAFASWCQEQALAELPEGERDAARVHEWRAGVVEIVADARARDLFFPIEDVRAGVYEPQPGDLAIWDRSKPGGPAWWRHVNRVVSYDTRDSETTVDDLFVTVGGNEGRTIKLNRDRPKELSAGKLLGFVSYGQRTDDDALPVHPLTDAERVELRAMIAMSLDDIARDVVKGKSTVRGGLA